MAKKMLLRMYFEVKTFLSSMDNIQIFYLQKKRDHGQDRCLPSVEGG